MRSPPVKHRSSGYCRKSFRQERSLEAKELNRRPMLGCPRQKFPLSTFFLPHSSCHIGRRRPTGQMGQRSLIRLVRAADLNAWTVDR
jgi:hypothetical protein